MPPSKVIIEDSEKSITVSDKSGRSILVRQPNALDTLRLFKAAGPTLAQNEAWLAMAGTACCAREIDGIPIPTPINESQIEALVSRLGDDGLAAIAASLVSGSGGSPVETQVGNLPGTLC